MQCPSCGAEVVEQSIFCHRCGRRIDETRPDAAEPLEEENPSRPADALRRAGAAAKAGDSPEKELWRGGFSPKAMIYHWVFAAVASIALLTAGILWVRGLLYWTILLAAILILWLYGLCVLTYRRLSVRYVLTSQRFIHESGILRRVNDRIEVIDMDDIAYVQGLLERLVGVGTIRISSSDRTHPTLDIRGIDDVQAVSELFDNARRAERRLRGLHIEQI